MCGQHVFALLCTPYTSSLVAFSTTYTTADQIPQIRSRTSARSNFGPQHRVKRTTMFFISRYYAQYVTPKDGTDVRRLSDTWREDCSELWAIGRDDAAGAADAKDATLAPVSADRPNDGTGNTQRPLSVLGARQRPAVIPSVWHGGEQRQLHDVAELKRRRAADIQNLWRGGDHGTVHAAQRHSAVVPNVGAGGHQPRPVVPATGGPQRQ